MDLYDFEKRTSNNLNVMLTTKCHYVVNVSYVCNVATKAGISTYLQSKLGIHYSWLLVC